MGVSKLSISKTRVAQLTGGPVGFDPSFLSILLLALPSGTSVVGFEAFESTFSDGYYIMLDNPIFKDNTTIYARYDREAALDPGKPGEIVQFSQFKGFDLTDALGR